MMESPLRISNIVMTGRIPLVHKLREQDIKLLITNSSLTWQTINEESSPILQAFIEKETMTIYKKKRNACISLWSSGAINIVGVQTEEEGHKIYAKVYQEVRKHCKRAFE